MNVSVRCGMDVVDVRATMEKLTMMVRALGVWSLAGYILQLRWALLEQWRLAL